MISYPCNVNTYRKVTFSIFLLLLLCFAAFQNSNAQSNIRMSLTRNLDKGIFNPSRQFGEYISDLKAFKFDSTSYELFSIWKFTYDQSQNSYNNFIKSNRTDSTFILFQKRFGWDSSQLSKGYENNTYVFAGLKKNGEYIIIPDKNANKDFTDDTEYLYRLLKVPKDSLKILTNQLPIVKFPVSLFMHGTIQKKDIAVQFIPKVYFGSFQTKFKPPVADSLLFVSSIHEYLEGKIELKNTQHTILIRNNKNDVRYSNKEAIEFYILSNNKIATEAINEYSAYKIGDTIPIGSELYKLSYLEPLGKYLDLSYAGKNMNIGVEPGSLAKYFSGKNVITGKQLNLNNYKGSYVLLDFWGTWCAPCKEILPDIKNFSTQYRSRPFKVISIAYDEEVTRVKKFIKMEKMLWDNLFEPFEKLNVKSIITDYKVMSYPTTILIDPKGKILFRATSIQEFKELKMLVHRLFNR